MTRATNPERQRLDAYIGARIKGRRKALGQTQWVLADLLGVSWQQLQKYERSSNRISVSLLHDVVDGQPSVKRLVCENGQLGLMIENPAMPAFAVAPIADVAIWGVVRWTLRRHPGASR